MYRDHLLKYVKDEACNVSEKILDMIEKEESGTVELTPLIVGFDIYNSDVEKSVELLLNNKETILDMNSINGVISDCVTYVQCIVDEVSKKISSDVNLGRPYFKRKYITRQRNPKLPDKWCNIVFAVDFTYNK